MTAPHPSIVWQMRKTDATVAFVKEAGVAYFARSDFRDDERERLADEIGRLVRGEAELFVATSVDDWLTDQRSPRRLDPLAPADLPPAIAWQADKTAATVAFVKEAEALLMARTSDLTPAEGYQLRAKIDRLKAGDESCEESETVTGWLERLRDHYP